VKNKKKLEPHKIEHKIRKKKREKRIALAVAATILIIIILISGFFINSILNQSSTYQAVKVAIVDQLSLAFPNQTFVETATNILKQARYSVDYYSGEKVTVEFYRNLPTHRYHLLVLRVHSVTHNPMKGVEYTGLFTSESFDSERYNYERNTLQAGEVAFQPYHEGDPTYFAITSRFVQLSMVGMFEKTTIIMMGCWGLTYQDLAKAFISKGAQVYISWSKSVLLYHTDTATVLLLQHLVAQKQTVEQSVKETMKEIGSDPESHSVLLYYPPELGNYTL